MNSTLEDFWLGCIVTLLLVAVLYGALVSAAGYYLFAAARRARLFNVQRAPGAGTVEVTASVETPLEGQVKAEEARVRGSERLQGLRVREPEALKAAE